MDLTKLTSEELAALFEREKLRRELTENLAGLIDRASKAGFTMREIMPLGASLTGKPRSYAKGTKSEAAIQMLKDGQTVQSVMAALDLRNSGMIYEAAKRRGLRIEKGRLARMS